MEDLSLTWVPSSLIDLRYSAILLALADYMFDSLFNSLAYHIPIKRLIELKLLHQLRYQISICHLLLGEFEIWVVVDGL